MILLTGDYRFITTFFIIIWFVLFLFLFYLEYKSKQLYFINYVVATFITGVSGLFFATVMEQILIFMFVLVSTRIILHPYIKQKQIKRIFVNQACTFIGREAVVSKRISPDTIGEISINGFEWEAIPDNEYNIEVGELVYIAGKSGVNLVVSKIEFNK